MTYQAKDGTIKTVTNAELQDQLETSEKLMQGLNETWEEKLQRTQEVQKEREKALEELGITVEKNNVGVHTPKKVRFRECFGRWRCLCREGTDCLTPVAADAAFSEPGMFRLFLTKAVCALNQIFVVGRTKVYLKSNRRSRGLFFIFFLDPLMSECLIYQLKPGRTAVCDFLPSTLGDDL